ncbi:MAG: MBOAT family protein, partial [Planctomycetes bacterium]|nr:MBOAT family protein [Planctomycetota bacterium]
ILGGLWHGASWNFAIWGALHGLLLAAERAWGERSPLRRWPASITTALTFILVCFTWVFFRAESLSQALTYTGSLLGLSPARAEAGLIRGVIGQPCYLAALTSAALVTWTFPQTWDFTRRLTWPRAVLAVGLFWLALLLMTTQEYNPFIYFIF